MESAETFLSLNPSAETPISNGFAERLKLLKEDSGQLAGEYFFNETEGEDAMLVAFRRECGE